MTKRNLFLGGGAAVLALVMIAVLSPSARPQDSTDARIARLEQKVQQLREWLADRIANRQDRIVERLQDRMAQAESAMSLAQEAQDLEQRVKVLPGQVDTDGMTVLLGDEGTSWLGVESQEVTSEKAKELKLPAERGVLLQSVVQDSPASKAGLKENDVITEINGQRVEGTAQFRRMLHEIPAGRTVQFTVWRDGRAQTISVMLGKAEDRPSIWSYSGPRTFSFEMPRVEIPDFAIGPNSDWGYGMLAGGRPRLGIDAEDLSGQLGNYFGAPEGEGVLVREVNSGSPAEKAGLKSGDVITSLDGDRVRSLGDLREKLVAKREAKTVKLGVVRNRSEISITVELPPPPSRTPHAISHRTNI
jgi:serine protease Do